MYFTDGSIPLDLTSNDIEGRREIARPAYKGEDEMSMRLQSRSASEVYLSESEVEAFMMKLGQYRSRLPQHEQQLLDSLVLAASKAHGEMPDSDDVTGYFNPQPDPPGRYTAAKFARFYQSVLGGPPVLTPPGVKPTSPSLSLKK
jgi:hypothetical protein